MDPNRKTPLSPGTDSTQRTADAAARLMGPRAAERLPARSGLVHRGLPQPAEAAAPSQARRWVEVGTLAGPRLGAATTPQKPPAAATPLQRPAAAPGPRVRGGSVYRGLPTPVRVGGWLVFAAVIGAVLGATAPTAAARIQAVAALQPGLLAWYCVRALGFLAYLILAASVLYGLLLSTKILDAIAHRPVSFALHKDLAIVALIVGTLHGTLLTFDQSFSFTPLAILVPFESPYSPVSVGIGQLTLYATAVVTASFYVRRHIGQKTWRLLHYATFLAFVGASVHGIASGSDSGTAWAFWVYLVPVTSAVFLITYRMVVGLSNLAHRSLLERAGEAGSRPMSRGPLDRPGAAAGG
jgi:methionine sulfoxide reductase heme-binding subunit